MRRPLIGSGSILSMAMKPLLILALAFAAFFVAPAAASATPAGGSAADKAGMVSQQIKSSDVGINAVFTCRYFSRSPFNIIDFTCQVTSGAIRVYVNCTDGRQVLSGVLPAVGTYNVRLVCSPPSRLSTLGWVNVA
jgi:hypothetical protein